MFSRMRKPVLQIVENDKLEMDISEVLKNVGEQFYENSVEATYEDFKAKFQEKFRHEKYLEGRIAELQEELRQTRVVMESYAVAVKVLKDDLAPVVMPEASVSALDAAQ